MKKNKCKLPVYKIEPVLSVQDAKQKAGWQITAFDLPEKWKLSQGEGVKIAVLDTGCDLTHKDLKNNLLSGINLVQKGTPPIDKAQHGSHVTGIIVAENNNIGMVGVAPKAKVMPVKVLGDNGQGDLQTVAQGIRWAVDNGADIISMSLGSPNPVAILRKAIQYATNKGIPVFCAAGNAGNTKEIFYPAAYPETIGIGSIDENMMRSKFSCTGPSLDFLAPGGKIFSTVPDNWYAVLSGTSMAAPFVVGVAALLLSFVRSKKLNIINSVEDYRTLLKQYTIPLPDKKLSGKFFQGFGIIDPQKLSTWMESNNSFR